MQHFIRVFYLILSFSDRIAFQVKTSSKASDSQTILLHHYLLDGLLVRPGSFSFVWLVDFVRISEGGMVGETLMPHSCSEDFRSELLKKSQLH